MLKFLILFWTFLGLAALDSNSQHYDRMVIKKIEDTLRIIDLAITDPNLDPKMQVISATEFMLKLTGIPYEGRVTWFGPEFPARSFLNKCWLWVLANNKYLKWNAETQTIIFEKPSIQ